jgi:hypothetical protein
MTLLNKITPNCKEATLYAQKAEEEKITFSERVKLLFHLLYCAPCRKFVKQSKLLSQAIYNYTHHLSNNSSNSLSSNAKERMQEKINEWNK